MGIARRDCANESEAVIMASAMEEAGGTVFSVCQAHDGRWHVWARFPSADTADIDKHYRESIRALKKHGAFIKSRAASRRRAKNT